jgi:multimeric flavodoxin WrbA
VKVAIINGSENASGNTASICRWLVDTYRQKFDIDGEVISLADYSIQECGFCGGCNARPKPCGLEDDVRPIIDIMLASDIVIYAVPVHGFGMASVMQRFIERAGVGYLRFNRPLANKVGGVVVAGRRYSHEGVVAQLYLNILLNKMILPGSGFPVVFRNAEYPNFLDDTEGVAAANAMIVRTAEIAHLLRDPAGSTVGVGVGRGK